MWVGRGLMPMTPEKTMASLSVSYLPDLLSKALKTVRLRVIFASLWYTPSLESVALDLPSPLVVSSCMSGFVIGCVLGLALNKACR